MRQKKYYNKESDIVQRQRGFTLIELLVVISIIALLLGILIPTLGRARDQARKVLCLSNLRQWSVLLFLYTNDHEGSFPPGWSVQKGMWMSRLRSYYQDRKICLCPKATKLQSEGLESDVFVGWGVYGDPGHNNGWTPPWGDEGDYGSYSMNGWMCNPPDTGGLYSIDAKTRKRFWRTAYVNGKLSNIPVFSDGMWDGSMVRHNDKAPAYPGEKLGIEGMWNYCIPRHDLFINIAFLDNSVRQTSLKELWKLKWNKKFRTDVRPDIPDWMR